MELRIKRSYHPTGTNGSLFINGELICYTIELPWRDNHTGISCIPEGTYHLVKRYSPAFHWHLHLRDVPGREWILMHPANHALRELKGCIAPVSLLTGPGMGSQSRLALEKLMGWINTALQEQEPLFITLCPMETPGNANGNHETDPQKGSG
jgi:hypothetical protein